VPCCSSFFVLRRDSKWDMTEAWKGSGNEKSPEVTTFHVTICWLCKVGHEKGGKAVHRSGTDGANVWELLYKHVFCR